jgi:3-methyladenine DNA glycosylase AlkD
MGTRGTSTGGRTAGARPPARRAAPSAWAKELLRELRRAARPSAGFDARAYLSSPVPVLGVRVPDVQRIARQFDREHRDLPNPELERLAGKLWEGRWFEERVLGVELLRRRQTRLDDISWRMLDRWVDTVSGWGLTDDLGGLMGEMVPAHPDRYRDLLTWSRSSNLWRRRASLYALSRTIRSGDLDRALRLIDGVRGDPERWVQRAVGTWLRECWKVDASTTSAYLTRRAADLAPVTLTVATERASPGQREQLRARARAGRAPRRA